MLTPDGFSAEYMDKVMLLTTWARHLKSTNMLKKSMIFAGMGRPTYPVDTGVAHAMMNHWRTLLDKAEAAEAIFANPELAYEDKIELVKSLDAALDYGDPQGDAELRKKMATILNQWYDNRLSINAQHILFTVGGAGGLNVLFRVLKNQNPQGLFVTALPYYSLYKQRNFDNTNLYTIPVIDAPDYQLTASLLKETLVKAHEHAERIGTSVEAVIICDPNNPLGTIIPKDELAKIRQVLLEFPRVKIILDEAYAEIAYVEGGHYSLLALCDDIKERMIVLRSATKGLSSAGERMALLMCFDKKLMSALVAESIANCGHAPVSLQKAYTLAMEQLNRKKLKEICDFYKFQIDFVVNQLKRLNLYPNKNQYEIKGAFYVIGDFSCFYNFRTTPEMRRVLNCGNTIKTDEEIAYYLLFEEGIMLMPLSYFGASSDCGLLRITCSGGLTELKELIDRVEKLLNQIEQVPMTMTNTSLIDSA